METPDKTHMLSARRIVWALVAIALLARLVTLGAPAITDPSEGRYAVMAQNMVLSGDWLTPRTFMEGKLVPFLGKPPLHSWATALSYSAFGVNEASARLPSFLASAGTVVLCALLAGQCFGIEAAALGALLLLSSWLFFFLGSSCLTDPLLMFFVTLAMFAAGKMFLDPNEQSRRTRKGRQILFFAALGGGMMVKGPIAIAIPAVALLLWAFFARRFRDLVSLPWVLGAGVFLAIVSPWYILAEWANPGFLWYFFVNENLLRFFVKNYGDKYGSGHIYTYGTIWLFLASGFLPGLLMILLRPIRSSAAAAFRGPLRSEHLFFLFWAIAPAIIFTFSRQISPSYVLPGMPGLAALAGAILARAAERVQTDRIVRAALTILKGAAAVVLVLMSAGVVLHAGAGALALSLAVIAFLLLIGLVIGRRSDGRSLAVFAMLGTVALFFASAVPNIAPILGEKVSSREALEYAEHIIPKSDPRVGFLELAPYSAYFYSREPDDTFSVLRVDDSELESTLVPVLLVHRRQQKSLAAKILLRFHEIATVGAWTVYRTNSNAGAGV